MPCHATTVFTAPPEKKPQTGVFLVGQTQEAPLSSLTSPQMNFTPILRSYTWAGAGELGWIRGSVEEEEVGLEVKISTPNVW